MPESVIQEIGGGLNAVVIVALGLAVIMLWRRLNEVQDSRLADMREANAQHASLSREMAKSLDALTDAMRKEARG